MDEQSRIRRDRKELIELANTYLDYRRCCGGHLVHERYCCLHCGSNDPDTNCIKEGVSDE